MVEQEGVNYTMSFAIGIAVSVFLAVAVILFLIYYQRRMFAKQMQIELMRQEHQKKILETIVESQEKERRRIASDLHDDVGAILSTAKLYVTQNEMTETKGHSGSSNMVLELLEQAIGSLRSISRELLPANLERFGLESAIETLCQRINDTEVLMIQFRHQGLQRLPKMVELHLYRIVQELLNNTIKHAEAAHISIRIEQDSDRLVLNYKDDGKGFSIPSEGQLAHGSGLGLKTIASRAELLHGRLRYREVKDKGVEVELTIEVDKFKS